MRGHIPRLDSFRGIAALGVIWGHYAGPLLPSWLLITTMSAVIAVQFFFVLSGFLITGLLLDEENTPSSETIKKFYIRRSFRIFPLYYFALALGIVLDIPDFRATIEWTATYLSNFFMVYGSDPHLGFAGHFWTLAVEEQFYLLWPAVLIFFRRAVWPIAGGMVIAAVAYKYFAFSHGRYPVAGMSLVACADALAIGALTAIACKQIGVVRVERALRWALPVTVSALILYVFSPSPVLYAFTGVGAFTFFAGLIVLAVKDGPNANSWGGEWLPFLGAISYGVYVYHFMVLGLLHMSGLPDPTWLFRTIAAIVTILAAWLSYRFFEEPLRRYGRQMTERQRLPAKEASPATVTPWIFEQG